MAAKDGRNRRNQRQETTGQAKSEMKVQEKVGGHDSWAAGVRSLFSCKDLQQQERRNAHKTSVRKQCITKKHKDDDEVRKEEQVVKSKKTRSSSSSSCCSHSTKVKMQIRPHHHQTSNSPSPHGDGEVVPEQKGPAAAALIINSTSRIDTSSNCASMHKYSSSSSSLIHTKSPPQTRIVNSETSYSRRRHIPNLRRLSGGCYECKMAIDPVVLGTMRPHPSYPTTFSCPHCAHIFMKADHLEIHLALSHAVIELGPDDTSKNIVEIIFQSSWLKKEAPVCKIDRILKVQNTQKTISKFEKYRDAIQAKASKQQAPSRKHDARCVADGNELLRFHCTSLKCCLGLNGSSNLCNSIPSCSVCSIIKNGFKLVTGNKNNSKEGRSILTTAASGKAHDNADANDKIRFDVMMRKRAMLVCRVIAGRVKMIKNSTGNCEMMMSSVGGDAAATAAAGEEEDYESVGLYNSSNSLDELHVFNPNSILPCFVVIYDY